MVCLPIDVWSKIQLNVGINIPYMDPMDKQVQVHFNLHPMYLIFSKLYISWLFAQDHKMKYLPIPKDPDMSFFSHFHYNPILGMGLRPSILRSRFSGHDFYGETSVRWRLSKLITIDSKSLHGFQKYISSVDVFKTYDVSSWWLQPISNISVEWDDFPR